MGASDQLPDMHTRASGEHPVAAPTLIEDLPIGSMVGEYRVESQIGEGGMGRVYAAIHPIIGKRVAVKVLRRGRSEDDDAAGRFVQEARLVNQINHPNHEGTLDIVVRSSTGVTSYLAPTWLTPTPTAMPTGLRLAVADLDGDNIPDAIAESSNMLVVLRGNGDGTFTIQTTLTAGGSIVDVGIGDFNGDGHPDLAAAVMTSAGAELDVWLAQCAM